MSKYQKDVNSGWLPLLERLETDLRVLGWTGEAHQVKEKYGTLRFYADPTGVPEAFQEAFYKRIIDAEHESARTCEYCGAPGTLQQPTGYWYKTVCAEHGT